MYVQEKNVACKGFDILSVVSNTHLGSWNLSVADKGGLLHYILEGW